MQFPLGRVESSLLGLGLGHQPHSAPGSVAAGECPCQFSAVTYGSLGERRGREGICASQS